MATKNSSKIFLIIGGIVLITGTYFLFKKRRKEKLIKEETNNIDESTSNSETDSGNVSPTAPSELSDSTKIKAFQDWLDTNKSCWVLDKDGKYKNLSKNVGKCNRNVGGKGYGNYGKNTSNAWEKFGKDYLDSLKQNTSTNTSTNTSSNTSSKNIDTIIGFSTGTKAERTFLTKTNADFVNTWAKAIKNKKNVFIWANNPYRTKTGDKILGYNPIGTTYYAKKTDSIAKLSPSDNATSYLVKKGTDLGKATGIDFNNGLWIYLPQSGDNFKWYKINDISKTKLSSSFDGTTDEIEFLNFDNNLDLNL